MKVLDFFKKKRKIENLATPDLAKPEVPKEKRIEEKKAEKKKVEEKRVEKPEKVAPPKTRTREKKIGLAYRVLRSPHISEKATGLLEKNQYTFKIWPRANKVEIKKAVEDLYGVDVLDVKVSKVPRKPRRFGRINGWRRGYKKAIVKIKEGQKIEVLPR